MLEIVAASGACWISRAPHPRTFNMLAELSFKRVALIEKELNTRV